MRSIAEFAVAAGVLTIIPGPDTMLALRTAVVQGRSQAIAAAVGGCTALAGWGCAAGLGLTAALAASPVLYAGLRWAGVGYLAYLGVRSLVAGSGIASAASLGSHVVEDAVPPTSMTGRFRRIRGSYFRGVITNASNPKVGVFYLSLFPQFIPAGAPLLGASLMLTSIHVAESLIWLVAVATLASKLARLLRRTSARRWADRVSGAAFLAFAARLATGG